MTEPELDALLRTPLTPVADDGFSRGLVAKMAAEEAADLIVNTVSGWSSSQNDDLTVIVCDYKSHLA